MSSAAPQISGKGCEDSTLAGNESALKFLNGFMTYLLNVKRAHAVDDRDSTVGVDLQEIAESGGFASSGSGSGAGESTVVFLSLKELVSAHLPLLTTRLFWGQFAYYATFTAEKKSGDAYAHGTAKGYFNSGIRLVRECEDPPLSEAAKTFFVDAMKPKSWLKNIQVKMQRHFAKRAAQEGVMLVSKAPPVALKQVVAASSDLGEDSEREDPKLMQEMKKGLVDPETLKTLWERVEEGAAKLQESHEAKLKTWKEETQAHQARSRYDAARMQWKSSGNCCINILLLWNLSSPPLQPAIV